MTARIDLDHCCATCKSFRDTFEIVRKGRGTESVPTGTGYCFVYPDSTPLPKFAELNCTEQPVGIPLYEARLGHKVRQLLGLSTSVKSYF